MAEPFVGEIRLFSFGVIPKGWAACNGQILQISQNQALFTILSNRFGGDGRTTFALPDLRGRTPLNISGDYPIATIGGEAAHMLTNAEMPQHTHAVHGDSTLAALPSPEGNVWGTTAAARPIYSSTANVKMSSNAIGAVGSNQAHNNMQPHSAVSFCIALSGFYPSRN